MIEQPRRRWWPWIASIVVFLGVVGGSLWGLAYVLTPAADPTDVSPFTFVEVAQGEVGSSMSLNTVAAWTPVPVGANRASGVVTEVVVAPGDEVDQGIVLYRVDQRPVVVAQGSVPAYRAVGQGTEGVDVAQLQRLLRALGQYSGSDDGKAGAATVVAIKAWQRSLGLPQTGTVEIGDVIFVPQLPTRVALDEEVIARGAMVSGSEQVVRALPLAPVFAVPVTDGQAAMMPAGTRVQSTSPGGKVWGAGGGDRYPASRAPAG